MASRHTSADDALRSAELDQKIIERKRNGLTFQEIGNDLGYSKAYIHRRFTAAIRRIPEQAASEYRTDQLTRFATAREHVMDVLDRKHVTVSNGHVVSEIVGTYPEEDEAGERHPRAGELIYGDPIEDDGPILAAVDRLLKIDDQEAKLLGLYPATKVDASIDGALRYEVVGVPVADVV